MAHEKHVDLPDGFDALLRQTMSVEPSGEFLPRVRARIAVAPTRIFCWWRVALVAGPASLASLAFVVWLTPGPASISGPSLAPPPPRPHVGISKRSDPTPPRIEPAPGPPVASARSRGSAALNPRVTTGVDAARGPAAIVIVDERQRAALSALMRIAAEGKLTEEAFAHTTPQSTDGIRGLVRPVSVAPVEVSPIAVGGVLQIGTEQKRPPQPESGASGI